MKNKSLIIGVAILIVLLLIGIRYRSQKIDTTIVVTATASATLPSTTPVTEPLRKGTGTTDIYIDNISPNQIIESPLTLTGKAKGYFFEGSFPVELKDANEKILYQGHAVAESDWMTTEFVPFKIVITFTNPTTSTGTLLFNRDNPSGLPENDKSFILPIQFKANERTVSLYYYKSSLDKDVSGNVLCSSKGLVPLSRNIPVSNSPLLDTMRLFLKGELTKNEINTGITTEYPLLGVSLQNINVDKNGLTTFALTDPNYKTSGGSCRASVLKAQFETTARQFPSVKNIQYAAPVFQP